ncbi:hypothetical protein ACHAWF_001484, partial [Thalassiosira exigua]
RASSRSRLRVRRRLAPPRPRRAPPSAVGPWRAGNRIKLPTVEDSIVVERNAQTTSTPCRCCTIWPALDEPLRILEFAAGPARHSLAALSEHPPSKVDSVLALDASQAMVDYGTENVDHELCAPGGRRDDFRYVKGDMRNVGDSTRSSFDSAWMLLGSMQHIFTNKEVITCFSSIRSVLEPRGHRGHGIAASLRYFQQGECTSNGLWTVPLVKESMNGDVEDEEHGELNIVLRFTAEMEFTVDDPGDILNTEVSPKLLSQISKEGKTEVREIVPMRLFTLQEIDALARCADEEEAFRMVGMCVEDN